MNFILLYGSNYEILCKNKKKYLFINIVHKYLYSYSNIIFSTVLKYVF